MGEEQEEGAMGMPALPLPSRKPFRFFSVPKSASGGASVRSMQPRLMFGVDIENFSGRASGMQEDAQWNLAQVLNRAALATGIDPRRWLLQPGGDGALIVLPEGLDYARTVGRLPANLERELARIARLGRPGPRLRLRLAFHYGVIVTHPVSPFGPAGDAVVQVRRLVDADPVRRLLDERPGRDLALIVSDAIYRDVVASGLCELSGADFRRVDLTIKKRDYHGHLHEPSG
ncbi:hypothetical protein [Actinomadura sp. WMMB 499]|uniref:hypothetical protein n=1 Tax=Actinomadura sp. WMMB 499 TaxID=1219491 RepID=UPI0012490C60|nr:hypothetical protein [Actinomadura sp. WMMB 499]QFG23577.1 hypothetical protein F7P10_23100 [Actinomadura sp. WMMB 499]